MVSSAYESHHAESYPLATHIELAPSCSDVEDPEFSATALRTFLHALYDQQIHQAIDSLSIKGAAHLVLHELKVYDTIWLKGVDQAERQKRIADTHEYLNGRIGSQADIPPHVDLVRQQLVISIDEEKLDRDLREHLSVRPLEHALTLEKASNAEQVSRQERNAATESSSQSSHRSRRSRIPRNQKGQLDVKSSKYQGSPKGTDAIADYLKVIGRTPLLEGKQEEVELMQIIEAGREAAIQLSESNYLPLDERVRLQRAARYGSQTREQFLKANLRLVVSIAKKYPIPNGMELLDVIQEGNLGLDHAIDKYDWRKGFKFSTYATFWIRQAIGRALDNKSSLIRLPSNHAAELRAAVRAANEHGLQLDEEQEYFYHLTIPAHLDSTINESGDADMYDVILSEQFSPEMEAIQLIQQDEVAALLDSCEPRQRYMLEARFGFLDGRTHTYREIGEAMGITGEAVRSALKNALGMLRWSASEIGIEAS